MFCGKCGVEIDESHDFCTKCGTKKVEKNTNGIPPQPKSSKSMLVIGIGFLVGVLSIIAIVSAVNTTTDPYGCTQCDPFLPGYDGPPPIYIEPDFGYDDGYYDDGYYDDYYYGGDW